MSWDEAHDLTVEPEEIDEADIDPENVWTSDALDEEIEREFLREVNAVERRFERECEEEERLLFLDDLERWR